MSYYNKIKTEKSFWILNKGKMDMSIPLFSESIF